MSRIQVNNDGVLINAETELPSNTEQIIRNLFSRNNWIIVSLTDVGGIWQLDIENRPLDQEIKLNLFWGKIRDEKRKEGEKKIQLGSRDPRKTTSNRINIILGVYCLHATDDVSDMTFAGWYIDERTNYLGNPSIRGINVNLIQKAKLIGFIPNKLNCIFRPEFIYYYITNLTSLYSIDNENTPKTDETLRNDSKINQIIYYGAPGTGKSHKIKELIANTNNKTIATFHPDTDYASFVGCYKPKVTNGGEKITYEFVPQAFSKAYIAAWRNLDQPYYLIIEEINRGNCAQIFGDIFQLLDRRADGFSEYIVDIDSDFAVYLKSELGEVDGYLEKIAEVAKVSEIDDSYSKIALPNNLHILATMNTSDQSLFPMDSAFKRRWDWEYIPIQPNKVNNVVIRIGSDKYSWSKFITNVNIKITKANDSEDKQLGPFFVKAKKEIDIDGKEIEYISEDRFVSKVLFYLWFEVFKDEVNNTIFFTKKKAKDSDSDDIQNKTFTFNSLFIAENEGESEINSELLNNFMQDSLEMKPIDTDTAKPAEEATTKPVVAEQ